MTSVEDKCLSFVKKHFAVITYCVLTLIILGLYIQTGMHFDLSSPPLTDFNSYIKPWWNQIVSEG